MFLADLTWPKKGRTANLTLHSIGSNEFAVIEDGNSVGRIMLAVTRTRKSGCGIAASQGPVLPAGQPPVLKKQRWSFDKNGQKDEPLDY
jgi:hypothetical protein